MPQHAVIPRSHLTQLLAMGACQYDQVAIDAIRPIAQTHHVFSTPAGFIRFSGPCPSSEQVLAGTVRTSLSGHPLSQPIPVHLVACEDGSVEVHANTLLRKKLFSITPNDALEVLRSNPNH